MVLEEQVGGSCAFFLKSSAGEAFQPDSGGFPGSTVAILLNCFPEQLPTQECPSAFTFCLNIPLVIEHSHLGRDKKGN